MRKLASRDRLLASLALVAALMVGLIAACSEGGSGDRARQRGLYIEETWQSAREVSGHRVHVVSEKIACSKCHDMTDTAMGKVTPARCAACHEKEGQLAHATRHAEQRFGSGVKTDCTDCHAFKLDGSGHAADAAVVEADIFEPGDCKRCHARAQGEIPAVEVHGTEECTACHQPHEDEKPTSAACTDCHREIHTTHAAAGKSIQETCSTCHEHQHAAAIEARSTCAECHAREQPIVPATALFEGHRECVSCHQPHGFEKTAAVACRSCHADQHVLGGPGNQAHNQCTNCHAPHDVKGAAIKACQSCHEDVHLDHPVQAKGSACTSCHDPHPARAHADSSASCSSCHEAAPSDHAFHAGTACTKCHQPHDFVRATSEHASCASCHAERLQQVAHNAGHQACEGCHQGLPHRPTGLEAGCESCHTSEHAQATRGHAVCTTCHEPHSGAQTKTCTSCHQSEHQSAPAGHQSCTSCHQPHSGAHDLKTCASCHASEAQSAHGQVGSGCATCHRPHGPSGIAKPPACATCHRPKELPGLHTTSEHQACSRCHSGHGDTPAAARGACLSCHRDKKDHFPDAPRCANCHLFTQHR